MPDLASSVETADEAPRAQPIRSGARSGALIAGASLVATGLNYLFLLAAGRRLGSEDYGALAALLGLLTVVLLPTGGLQLAVSREVSRRVALGDATGADAFSRATVRLGLLLTLPVLAIGLLLVIPLRELLDIESTGAVAIAMCGLMVALAYPITTGILQGFQRFGAVAGLIVAPFALRIAALIVATWGGLRLGGVVFAAVAGGIAATAIAVWLVKEPVVRGAVAAAPDLKPFLRYLGPVVIGLIGIAVLTNVDVLVVRARFSPDEAGEYAAASAFARIAFFLPATILAVIFPRTAARQARGEETSDILGRSLLATAAFGGGLALFYWMTGRGIVHTSFGGEFADGGELLVAFTFAMALYALVNLLVGFHLSQAENRYAWIVAASVPVQIALFATVPDSVEQLIWVNVAVAGGLLVAHELFVGSSVPAIGTGLRHMLGGIRVARGPVVEGALVLLGATLVVSILFWPVVTGLDSTLVASGSDALGGVWSFWRMEQEGGYHLFGTTHHTLTGAPFGWDEGNGLNLQWLLPYYPAYLATKVVGAVAAYNLVLLTGYVLSGAAMYALVRYLGCGRLVAAWAGLVYIVFPWHLYRTPHASLVHLELLPLLVLALVAAARRPTPARYVLIGAATAGCWLTSGYFGTMAVAAAIAFAIGVGFTTSRRSALTFLGGTAAAATAGSFLVAFLAVLAGASGDVGAERVPGDLSTYGLRPIELVVPTVRNIAFGDQLETFWGSRMHGSNGIEIANDLGLLTVVLALVWVVIWIRRRDLPRHLHGGTLGLLTIAVTALVFAAPSPTLVFGHAIWMPSRVLWEVVPAFRVPTRWVPLLMTVLVPLAALALQTGYQRLRRAERGQALAAVLVLGAMVFSVVELTIDPAEPRIRTTLPPVYQALERTPPGILAEYPLVEDADNLFWQRDHGRPILNSSAFGTPADEARRVLVHPGIPGTAEALALLGVTAIITRPDALDYAEDTPDIERKSWGPGYELVTRTPDGASLWRVTAPAAPALVTLPGGFTGPTRATDGDVGYPLVSPSGVGTLQFTAKAPSVVRLTFDAIPPGDDSRVLRVADAETELPFTLEGRTPVSVLVDIPRGTSYVLVKTDPAATSQDDAIVITTPRARTAAQDPQLRAVPISADPGF
jgi:O-antigen/teichoic acid export membrane protein